MGPPSRALPAAAGLQAGWGQGMCCLPCPYPAERQDHPGLTICCCLPGPSGQWAPPCRSSRSSICPCRHYCYAGALPSPSCHSLILHLPQTSQSKEDTFPPWTDPTLGTGCTLAVDSDRDHKWPPATSSPKTGGMERGKPERCTQLPCEHLSSQPGWQGWTRTKRREEERAKVELTYRWLFKSIKGR